MKYKWPDNFDVKPMIKSAHDDTVTFVDGTKNDYDTIIMATGYVHNFPFLED